jgi:7-carboxy-7-deazaguanine synthase
MPELALAARATLSAMETFCLDPSLDRGLLADVPAPDVSSDVETVPINDITSAVQWLGVHTGTPAIFVRTQGCSLRCTFCDVPETWREAKPAAVRSLGEGRSRGQTMRHQVTKWRRMSGDDVTRWCRTNYRQRHVVVTGGEPAMHAELGRLCEALLDGGYSVQLETSGTYVISVPDPVWVTVSPKIGMGRVILTAALTRANEIVMPISKAADLVNLAREVVPRISPRCRIYLHPIAAGAAVARAVESAFSLGYRVTSAAWVR